MPRKQLPPGQKPKKKKGRAPAHQNEFAFRHNPKSKLTEKILASPNVGVCQKCHDKIEWRKQYRKYKPLSQPSTCNLCKRRNITAAYHNICNACAKSDLAWKKMMMAQTQHDSESTSNTDVGRCIEKPKMECKVCAVCVKEPAIKDGSENGGIEAEIEEQIQLMEEKLKRPLKLRESKAIERKVTRAHEREKERLKAERRKARDEEAAARLAGSNDNTNGDGDEKQKGADDSSESDQESLGDESDDDPFLQAVGGQNKLLTGEAYQQMMLEKARLGQVH